VGDSVVEEGTKDLWNVVLPVETAGQILSIKLGYQGPGGGKIARCRHVFGNLDLSVSQRSSKAEGMTRGYLLASYR
jgi:hypothetical protein